jgi:hypothetical protein
MFRHFAFGTKTVIFPIGWLELIAILLQDYLADIESN